VSVGRERIAQAAIFHYDEADAVREAPILVWPLLAELKRSADKIDIDWNDLQQRISQCDAEEFAHAEPVSREFIPDLGKHGGGAHKAPPCFTDNGCPPTRYFVVQIAGPQQSDDVAGVQEDALDP
jgi:hypothetical protein